MAIPRNLGNLAQGADSAGVLGVTKGGTGSTTLTANSVLLGNGTSALQSVAAGASGNVLTSNGTTWTSAAAGGGSAMTLIATRNITSSVNSVSWSSLSTYDYYLIEYNGVVCTADNTILLQIGYGGGTYATSGYGGMGGRISSGNFEGTTGTTAGASLDFGYNQMGNNAFSGTIDIMGASRSDNNIQINVNSGSANPRYYFGTYYAPYIGQLITNLRMICTNGQNINSGRFSLYGISS